MKNTKDLRIALRIDEKTHKALLARANRERRSLSSLARNFIEDALVEKNKS